MIKHVLPLSKAEKPYGHTSYTRRSSKGKLVFVAARGVKPTEEEFSREIKLSGENPYDGDNTAEENDEHIYFAITKDLIKKNVTSESAAKKIIARYINKHYDISKKDLPKTVAACFDELVKDGVVTLPSQDKKARVAGAFKRAAGTEKSKAETTFEAALALLDAPGHTEPHEQAAFNDLVLKYGVDVRSHLAKPKETLTAKKVVTKALIGLAKVLDIDNLVITSLRVEIKNTCAICDWEEEPRLLPTSLQGDHAP